MSLNKMNSVFDAKCESFDIRVCDDLSEVILNYLPLKDKFRYECVSKQFQRTIFQRHYELNINQEFINSRDLKTYESIFKKLSNIQSVVNRGIYQSNFSIDDSLNDSILGLIIKYSNNLNEFKCDLFYNSESMKVSFFQKYGIKLKSICVRLSDITFINESFSNIEEIEFRDDIPGNVFDHIFKVKLKNLKRLSIDIKWAMYSFSKNISIDEMTQSVQRLFEYNKNITHLTIKSSKFSEHLLNPLFKGISLLKKLVHFKFHANQMYSIRSILNCSKQLTLNCHKLRELRVKYFLETKEESQLIEFLRQFKEFKQLKRLDIICRFTGMDSPLIDFCSDNYFKSGFENLTHLRISTFITFSDLRFEEKLLEDIDINLPKLQELVIKTAIKATEQTAETLSRLTNLETLELNILDKSFCDSFKDKYYKKCRKIKSIKL